MSLRIIAFIDHEIGFRLLKKLISIAEKKSEVQLVAVVTTLENGKMWWPGVESLCSEARIPFFRYSANFAETLAYENIDWYFLISWKHIIPEVLISHPVKGVINLHYSLLPEYRGVYPVNWAIIDGKEKTGVTYHFVNSNIDDGPIILQGEALILSNDTARSLQIRLDDLADELFDELLQRISKNKLGEDLIRASPNVLGSYKVRGDFNKIRQVDLGRNYLGSELLNLLRGMTFLPGSKNAYFVEPVSGKKFYLNLKIEEEGEQT